MNIKRIVLAVFLAAGLTSSVLWLLNDGLDVRAAPVYGLQVCPSGCAFSSIQDAVDAAAPGELIQVVTGVYTGVHAREGITQVVYISKTVTIRGGYNADFSACNPLSYPTTLDAQGQGRVLYIADSSQPTIEGLRITGGDATGLGGGPSSEDAGGGVCVNMASPVISNTRIYSNKAYRGGGVYLNYSNATLNANTISSNTAGWAGGGLWLNGGIDTLNHNTIFTNTALYGGGVGTTDDAAVFNNNTIISNTATASEGGGLSLAYSNATLNHNTIVGNKTSGWGGGLYATGGHLKLNNNAILRNTAAVGGGARTDHTGLTLDGNDIAHNQAAQWGGGVFINGADITLSNNTVSTNTAADAGGGLYISPANIVTLTANTIFSNVASYGGGVLLGSASAATLERNVIVSNTAGNGGGLMLTGNDARLVNNVIADNQASYDGGGLYVEDASPTLLHTTIARNSGPSGVYVSHTSIPSHLSMTNTIIFSHTVGIWVTAGNTATLNATLWHANATPWGGNVNHTNDHNGDPAFDTDGYHLTSASMAINQGVNAGVTADIEGEIRPQGGGYDIGADETPGAAPCIPLTSVTINGPATGLSGEPIFVAAVPSPSNALPPITYTWSSDGLVSGQNTTSAHYTWSTLGPKIISVTIQNCGGVKTDSHSVTVIPGLQVCSSGCPYSTIQAAVDAANPGDVIKVAQGTYTDLHLRGDITQVVYISKTVTIRGGYATAFTEPPDPASRPTVVDAQGLGRVLVITGTITPTIEGLRLTGGDPAGLGPFAWGDVGGGVYINAATVVLSNVLVYSNTAASGGGLFLHTGSMTLTHSSVASNTSSSSGAGIELYQGVAYLDQNVISHNRGQGWGGGVEIGGASATLEGNTITYNYADDYGGGVSVSADDAVLRSNLIMSNTANSDGGGMHVYWSAASLTGNVIQGNVTPARGGGVFILGNAGGQSPTLVNNALIGNQAQLLGPGLYILGSSPRLLHTTLSRNTGSDWSAIHVDNDTFNTSHPVLTNTLIANHGVGITVTAGNTATLNATLWHNVGVKWGGNVNHTNDHEVAPAFAADGYHLTASSAAINKGVNAGVTSDIDGELRPQDGGYDLGADEVKAEFKLYLPLVLRNRN